MGLPYEDEDIRTENPFVDLIVHNVKVLGFNAVQKDQVTADKNETVETLRKSDLYIACIEKTAELGLFDYIPQSFLIQVGMSVAEINRYEKDKDQSFIPDKFHEPLVELLIPWYIENYIEKNEYYRMICGMPPNKDPGIPIRDYEYLIPADLTYEGDFFHEVGYAVNRSFEAAGILDVVRAEYPEYKYLNYLTQGINIYDARKKMDMQLLWVPENMNQNLTEEYKLRWAENRKYVIDTVYSSEMEIESTYYHDVMMMYLNLITMIDMLVEVQSHITKRDILDRRCIEYIFSMYGVPYYKLIPYIYQERMCKNIYSLLKYKSSPQEMINLSKLFGFENLTVFKWYLLKARKVNAWGEFEYELSTQITCKDNDIIDHLTVTEDWTVLTERGNLPTDLNYMINYYPDSGIEDDYPALNVRTTSLRSTLLAATSVPSITTGHIDRYIPFPFDYFLQKGNVMFVRLNGRVLEEGVDYNIHSYNIIRFKDASLFNNSDHSLIYEFYYDKSSVTNKFYINQRDIVETQVETLTYNGTNLYDLNPKWTEYFDKRNNIIVTVNNKWVMPSDYVMDYVNGTIKFLQRPAANDEVKAHYIYSKALKTRFLKTEVNIMRNQQTEINIPEPSRYYLLNGNEFFITLNDKFVPEDQYTVTPSTTLGNSILTFKNATNIARGDVVTFGFIYASAPIVDTVNILEAVETVTATKDYQCEYDIHLPVDNYIKNGYPIFVKFLGWWLPEAFFKVTSNNTLIISNRVWAQFPRRELEIHYFYPDKADTSNFSTSSAYCEAKLSKQANYKVQFPTSNFLTKGNKMVVDVEGVPLTQGVDYTVNEDTGIVWIDNIDYRPAKGKRVNFTFFFNKDAEQTVGIKSQIVEVTNPSAEISIPYPFYPYLETGHDFIVMINSKIIDRSRVHMQTNFTCTIDNLNTENYTNGLVFLFFYNKYYSSSTYGNKLTVKWKKQKITEASLDMATPFQNYVEKQWPYFVTYGDRKFLTIDKYDVFDHTFYTYPTEDLLNKVYGNDITFVYIYTTRKDYIFESISENYEKTTDLYFSKCPIDDIYSSQYMKDKSNWRGYDSITLADGWWDGRFYKHNSHQIIKNAIYEDKWNYARTKYFGIANVMDLGEFSNQLSYFFSILYDDVLLEKDVKLLIPSLSASHQFNIAHLFIYMTVLTYIFNGIEDFILDTPTKLLWVNGFNFKADLEKLKKYIQDRRFNENDFPIWDFILPDTQVKDFAEFINNYRENYKLRQTILKGTLQSEDYREYEIWKEIYDSLLIWKLNFKYFELEDGTVAKTYTEFLKEKDNLLYQSIQEILSIKNDEERQDLIIETCKNIIYIMDREIDDVLDDANSKEDKELFKYLFESYPGTSSSMAAKYLHMMIDFFKSYKIVLMARCEQMEIKDPNDPNNYMRPIDMIETIHETTNYGDYMIPNEVFESNETMNLVEWVEEPDETKQNMEFPFITRRADEDNTVRYTDSGRWMKEDVSILEGSGSSVRLEFLCKLNVNKLHFEFDLPAMMKYDSLPVPANQGFIAGLSTMDKDLFSQALFVGDVSLEKTADYSNIFLEGSVTLDGRLFLSGYKIMEIYRPILNTINHIPVADYKDFAKRTQDRISYDNISEQYMNAVNLTMIPNEVEYYDSTGVLYYNNFARFCKNAQSLSSFNFWPVYFKDDNTDKVFTEAFYNCLSLNDMSNGSLSEYTTSKGKVYMERMFYNCVSLSKAFNYIRTFADLDLTEAFYNCISLTESPKIEVMYGNMSLSNAFEETKSLKYLPSLVFPTDLPTESYTVNMTEAFKKSGLANSSTSAGSGYSFGKVKVILDRAFELCQNITRGIVINTNSTELWMTETYKDTLITLTSIFTAKGTSVVHLDATYKGTPIVKVDDVHAQDNSIIYMNNTYEDCVGLTVINDILDAQLPGFFNEYHLVDTFKNCSNLTTVTLDASAIKTITNVFEGCTKLTDVYFKNVTTSLIASLTHANLDGSTLSYNIHII